jgi:hypothetical protein
MNKLLLLSASFAAFAGCRGSDTNTTIDGNPNTDSPIGGSVKVSDVQNLAMAPGTAVTLKGVVVTAIDKFGAKQGNIFVADPGGGAFSGVMVFGAPAAQVGLIKVGDIVTIEGAKKDEFVLMKNGTPVDMTGRTTTELSPITGGQLTVTKTGTGTVPAPAMVDAAAIAMMDRTGQDAEWEKWEGVLITVTNVTALSAPKVIGGTTPDPSFKSFNITGFAKAESGLADFPVGLAAGDCLASITGMGDYFFDYLIQPRSGGEVVTGGSGCAPIQTSTVAMIQTGATAPGSNVKLTDVFVTANGGRGIWVADALAGAVNNGVYLFTGADPAFPIGTKVNVFGTTTEFDVSPPVGDKLTEIKGPSLTLSAAAGAAPTPLATTAAIAGDIGVAGEPLEGVLVSIPTLKVTAVNGTGATAKITMVDKTANTILVYQDAGTITTLPTVGACLNVTGVMSVDVTTDKRTLNPRIAADIATGTGCN